MSNHRANILLYAGTSVVKNLKYPLLPSVERVKMYAVRTISRKLSIEDPQRLHAEPSRKWWKI